MAPLSRLEPCSCRAAAGCAGCPAHGPARARPIRGDPAGVQVELFLAMFRGYGRGRTEEKKRFPGPPPRESWEKLSRLAFFASSCPFSSNLHAFFWVCFLFLFVTSWYERIIYLFFRSEAMELPAGGGSIGRKMRIFCMVAAEYAPWRGGLSATAPCSVPSLNRAVPGHWGLCRIGRAGTAWDISVSDLDDIVTWEYCASCVCTFFGNSGTFLLTTSGMFV